jgi:hypothetical protein
VIIEAAIAEQEGDRRGDLVLRRPAMQRHLAEERLANLGAPPISKSEVTLWASSQGTSCSYRFFSSDRIFDSLEGREFRSARGASAIPGAASSGQRTTVRGLLSRTREPGGP